MWTSVLPTAALFALVTGLCHYQEKNYYDELGCKPMVVGDAGCARSYDCSSLCSRNRSKCSYNGKEYDEGHVLEEAILPHCECVPDCRVELLVWSCAILEPPEELFGTTPKVILAKNDSAEQKVPGPFCQYKNKSYPVGETFYPEEDPCFSCICQPEYKGPTIQPFCQKDNCSFDLLHGYETAVGCIPMYYGKKFCCPIGWRCPKNSDTVVPSTVKESSNPGLQCKFGNLTMQVGDKLSPIEHLSETECECRVPPHPICIQKPVNT